MGILIDDVICYTEYQWLVLLTRKGTRTFGKSKTRPYQNINEWTDITGMRFMQFHAHSYIYTK